MIEMQHWLTPPAAMWRPHAEIAAISINAAARRSSSQSVEFARTAVLAHAQRRATRSGRDRPAPASDLRARPGDAAGRGVELVVWSERRSDVVMIVCTHDFLDDLDRPIRGIGWRQGRGIRRQTGVPEAILHEAGWGVYSDEARRFGLDPEGVRNASGDDPLGAGLASESLVAGVEGELAVQHHEQLVAVVVVPRR